MPQDGDITRILSEVHGGVTGAAENLLPIVYDELRGIAGQIFKSRPTAGNSLQPTILVHDVFMKLAQKTDIDWKNRSHFYAVAAKAIRNLLVDHARRQQAAKRGGGWNRITLDGVGNGQAAAQLIDVLDLEDALKRLGELAPRQERIVEMRFFAGLTVEDVAQVLGVSERTVMNDWRMARAWLRARLEDNPQSD
jgi:RNA polymerase sigma factor (TIGR02999 family)